MFCSKCGTELGQEANFCPKCGQAVGTAAVKRSGPAQYEYCRITWEHAPFGEILPQGYWVAEVDATEIARSPKVYFLSPRGNRALVSVLLAEGWEPMGSDARGNVTAMRRIKEQ
ncbi:MAG: zinc ribbon domain-containing protein [Chloroflexi bacterium]|nr:zinc ribbon domain-containing protein [Chloroflexota bacterium]